MSAGPPQLGGIPSMSIPIGTVVRGKVSWFGGPHDPTAGPTTASNTPISAGGIAIYNRATLGGYWQVTFPNGHTQVLQQTDLGPNPYTGRVVDVAYSSLPSAGYTEADFPTDSSVQAVYLGKHPGATPGTAQPGGTSSTAGGSSSSPSATPAEKEAEQTKETQDSLVGLAKKGLVYLALLLAAAAMLWLGAKTALGPRKRPEAGGAA